MHITFKKLNSESSDSYSSPDSSEEISIKDLANLICKIINYDGKISWDKTKPNGQPRRCVSYDRAKEKLGFEPKTHLEDGIKKTIEWFFEKN